MCKVRTARTFFQKYYSFKIVTLSSIYLKVERTEMTHILFMIKTMRLKALCDSN